MHTSTSGSKATRPGRKLVMKCAGRLVSTPVANEQPTAAAETEAILGAMKSARRDQAAAKTAETEAILAAMKAARREQEAKAASAKAAELKAINAKIASRTPRRRVQEEAVDRI